MGRCVQDWWLDGVADRTTAPKTLAMNAGLFVLDSYQIDHQSSFIANAWPRIIERSVGNEVGLRSLASPGWYDRGHAAVSHCNRLRHSSDCPRKGARARPPQPTAYRVPPAYSAAT